MKIQWCIGLTAACCASLSAQGQINYVSDAMVAGTDGYNVYRIPGFTVAQDGSLLLFAEGRPSSADPGGPGDIDLVYKRSTDGGQTWSNVSVLHQQSGFDFSDPRVVIDQSTGHAHLLYTRWPTNSGQASVPVGQGSNSANVFRMVSTDHGATWSSPINITTDVKDPSWASINTGPGLGIQLQWQDADPSRNGRMIVPAHHRPATYRGVAQYSDDGGATWNYGGSTPGFTDEAEIIELVNGDLLWDGRQQFGNRRERYISQDGGETWSNFVDSNITVTTVDTGIVRYSAIREGDDRNRILYSAPLGSDLGTGNNRNNIGVYTSYDEGRTFINPVHIQSGGAAYSVIDRMKDGSIGLIYENNANSVRFVNFDLAHLEGSGHAATMTHYDGFGNDVDRSNGGIGWSGSWQTQGNADFTDASNPDLGGSSIGFSGLRLAASDGRLDLNRPSGFFGTSATAQRDLATPIDMGEAGEHYFSFLIHQERDAGQDEDSGEFLNVRLLDGSGTSQAAFGVGSTENVFIAELGSTRNAGADSVDLDNNYMMVAKLVTREDGDATGDQLFVKVFADGEALPDTEIALDWTLVGTTGENLDAVIEAIRFESGDDVVWSVDELRIGTTYEGVVSGVVPEPSSLVLLAGGLGGLMMRRRRRN